MNTTSKKEFIDHVKHMTNYELPILEDPVKERKNVLYTYIPKKQWNNVVGYLLKSGYRYTEHLNNKLWILIK